MLKTPRNSFIGFIRDSAAKRFYDMGNHKFIIPYPTPNNVRTAPQIIPAVFAVVCLIAESVEAIACAALIAPVLAQDAIKDTFKKIEKGTGQLFQGMGQEIKKA